MKETHNKQKILEAGEKIISEKGVSSATISDIARRADVANSLIYQYFKNKESLLFSIAGERNKEFLTQLEEHLQGISDESSKLRKLLWFYLRFHDIHKDYSRVLILECLSSERFYKSPSYQHLRLYGSHIYHVLEQGIEHGVFRPDLDIRLLRYVIIGTLGCELISSIAVGETEETVNDLDDIMTLINAMISPHPQKNAPEQSTPEKILIAAEKIFAQQGYAKSRISQIAKEAGVSEPTVYDYFANKEELLLAIPEKRFENYLRGLPEIFEQKTPLRKLRRFINYFFSLFATEQDFLKTFLLQIQLHRRFYGSKAFEKFKNYFRVIESIVEEGKADGSFRQDVNPRVFRNMLIGTFNNLELGWFIFEHGKKIDKMQKIKEIADLFCRAVTVREDH